MSTERQSYDDSSATASVQPDDADTDTAETECPTLTAAVSVGRVQRFLDAIRTVNDEFQLEVTPDGLTGNVVNDSRTTMGSVHLDARACESYQATTGKITIQTGRLREVTRMTSNRDVMHLTLDGDSQTLDVEADGVECSLKMNDGGQMPAVSGLDEADHPSVCVLEGGELKRIMKAAGHVSTEVDFRIEHTRERFVAEANGDSDRLIAPREADDVEELLVGTVPVASTFDLGYLRQIRRPIHKRTEVTLALGTDSPLLVAFDIADGAGHVEYSIAPVVADDGDNSNE
jgi:proliferating cell nuclear antigen